MSSQTYQVIRGTAVLVLFVLSMGWFLWRWLKGSRDPALLIFRWLLSAAAFYGLWRGGSSAGQEGPGAWLAVVYGLLGGIFLALIWVPVVADYVSRKIGSLYDGGDAE